MSKVSLKEAKAGFSGLVDQAVKGEFVTITRHGKPVAALVSIEAAEAARKAGISWVTLWRALGGKAGTAARKRAKPAD